MSLLNLTQWEVESYLMVLKFEMIHKGNKILITGSSGMIGSSILVELKNNKYTNLLTPKKNELNLFNFIDVKNYLKKNQPEVIILASGRTGGIKDNISNSSKLILENIMMQNNVFFSLSELKNLKRLFFFGSSCVYPKGLNEQMSEELILNNEPEKSSISYAMAKLSGIYTCKALNKDFKKNICISLIPASCYGPNDNFDPISSHVLSGIMRKMIDAKNTEAKKVILWGSGDIKREFIFVDDVSRAILSLLNKTDLPEVINIGFGKDLTIKELANKIALVVGFKGKISWNNNIDGAFRKLLDSKKMFSMNWTPQINLTEGLTKTYNWVKLNGGFKK